MIMSRGSGDIRARADPDAVMSPLPGLVSKAWGLRVPTLRTESANDCDIAPQRLEVNLDPMTEKDQELFA